MSAELDHDFETAHDVLFAVFGEAAQIRRGRGTPVPVQVVITFDLVALGDYGQGLTQATVVKLRNRDWRARAGDTLQLASGRHRLDRIVHDDGLVTEAVLCG